MRQAHSSKTSRLTSTVAFEPNVPLPQGRLTDNEIETLRQVFAVEARGDILIGLRHLARLMPFMLPSQASEDAAVFLMQSAIERLRAYGADGYIHARRALLRPGARKRRVAALLIDQRVADEDEQTIVLLSDHKRRWTLRTNRVEDAVSRALREGMRVVGE